MLKDEFDLLMPLETKRLIINKTNSKDVNLLLKMDHQKKTQEFLGGIKTKTKEERIVFINNKKNSLTIFLKDKTSIGFIDFNINEETNIAELSYIFDEDYCNHGYCSEAFKKIIEIAFKNLNLNMIYANTIDGNNSSKRVLEKLGFRYNSISQNNNSTFLEYYLLKKDYISMDI